MHEYGDRIRMVRPKFIYFIGMSLAGLALAVYGLKTAIYPVLIVGALICAYGIFVIIRRRITFYVNAIVIRSLFSVKVIKPEDIERFLWHEVVPYNMAIAAQRKPALKCVIVLKKGPPITLDCGLYRKLREPLTEYAAYIGAPSGVV